MTISEEKYFDFLKGKIVETMKKTYPGIPNSISEWKGQNIIDFQTDLEQKQNQHLSEKWFYNHMKMENQKLPRIDILNFLSGYVGYKNWGDFKYCYSEKETSSTQKSNGFYVMPLIVVVVLTLAYFAYKSFYAQEYSFCFYDSVSKQAIANNIIEVTVLEEKESHRNFLCNADGCFTLKTNKKRVALAIETPYYHRDTIVRRLNSFNRSEKIKLKIDDYAIMIHYFSNSKVQDWMKRRDELSLMFSDNAKIFQVYEGTVGMEMYNKWEFINKLTMPTNSLNNIEILDTKYYDGEITHLRFIQNGK